MAQEKGPTHDVMTAGWLVFGTMMVDHLDAGRGGNGRRLGRWLARPWTKAGPEAIHRDTSLLSARERRELGLAPAVGGPAVSSNALTGLTLLSLAGR